MQEVLTTVVVWSQLRHPCEHPVQVFWARMKPVKQEVQAVRFCTVQVLQFDWQAMQCATILLVALTSVYPGMQTAQLTGAEGEQVMQP